MCTLEKGEFAMNLKDKITVLIGGKPAKDLPVGIRQDGVVAVMPSQTELPEVEFRRKLAGLNKREAEFKTVKEKAERMIQLAGTKEARERAELDGKAQQKIIAGFREEVRTADRASQLLKDERINLFLTECERIKAIRHVVWLKIHAEMIEPLGQRIDDAFINDVLNEQSEVYQEMVRIDAEIDSFNELAKQHKTPGNLFIPNTEKMVGSYEAAVREASNLGLRRWDKANKKINFTLDAKASKASEHAKKLERAQQMSSWLPDKYSNLPQF
jgi:hypothetical protein